MRTKTRIAALAIAGTAAVAGNSIATAPAAHAWAWSSQVTLTGNVKVIYHPGITGVYVSASDGERGWATLGSGNSYQRPYYFKFYNVPSGSGVSVRWTVYTNNGSFSGGFGVARPASGANAVRDLCDFSPGC